MATTKARPAEIGGFADIADHFTDDYELGNRLAASGYRVAIASAPVDTVYPALLSAKEYFRHQLRWALTIRHATPAGYLGLIFTHGLAGRSRGCSGAVAWLAAGYGSCLSWCYAEPWLGLSASGA